MPRLTILTDEKKLAFDYPPKLTTKDRALCFSITPDLDTRINHLRKPTNKVGFLLQYGYFKLCKRFFMVNRYHQEDVAYIAKQIGVALTDIELSQYKKKMSAIHQKIILNMLDSKPLNEHHLDWVKREIKQRVKLFMEPRQLFFEILQSLSDRQIEIPSYHKLSELISRYYIEYENNLLSILEKELSFDNKKQLDTLLEFDKNNHQSKLYRFKVISQSTKPKAIQASLNVFNDIAFFHKSLQPIMAQLALTQFNCEYYATWVKKSKLSQLKQYSNTNKVYLYLIAFIQHQYRMRQDAFTDIFLKSVRLQG